MMWMGLICNWVAPLKAVAVELGLRVHERDTFTGWDVRLLSVISWG